MYTSVCHVSFNPLNSFTQKFVHLNRHSYTCTSLTYRHTQVFSLMTSHYFHCTYSHTNPQPFSLSHSLTHAVNPQLFATHTHTHTHTERERERDKCFPSVCLVSDKTNGGDRKEILSCETLSQLCFILLSILPPLSLFLTHTPFSVSLLHFGFCSFSQWHENVSNVGRFKPVF